MKGELLGIAKRIMDEVDSYRESDLTEWIAEQIKEYADSEVKKFHKPHVSGSLPEDATTCLTCGEFEPYCKCVNGYKRQ